MFRFPPVWLLPLLGWLLVAPPLSAAPLWLAVTHTTRRQGATYLPEIVRTQAEQAMLPNGGGPPDRKRTGDRGAAVLRTHSLQFVCRDATYEVPDPFVDDLSWLGADSSVRATVDGKDAVFTMIGGLGEKGYAVHFHFREGRFFQRILDYGPAHAILVRTNDILTGR